MAFHKCIVIIFFTQDKVGQDVMTSPMMSQQQHGSTSSNNGWSASAAPAHESAATVDRGSAVTARAPPGLVPSSPWLQQPPTFNRSTSWTPQTSYGESLCFILVKNVKDLEPNIQNIFEIFLTIIARSIASLSLVLQL